LSICDLSWNGFGEDGGCAIADALMANTTLKVLDLSANRLTQSVAVRLAKALGHNEVLEVLRVSTNKFLQILLATGPDGNLCILRMNVGCVF